MSSRTKVVIVILLAGVLLAGCFGILLAYSLYKTGPALASDTVLEYKISGEIGDSPAADRAIRLFTDAPNSLFSIVDGIKRAKQDGRIKALLLIIQDPQVGYAKTEELRDALKDFRSSGKPIYVYMERGSDIDYYLATAADKIYLSPTGDLDVKGFAATATFLRGFFEKLKIEPNFERHGKYKSFADTYTRSDMSEEHREQISVLLDDIYSRYVAAIAEARKLDAERVKQLIDAGPYSNALKATDVGLIDGGLYLDEVREKVRADLKLAEYKSVLGKKYTSSRPFSFSAQKIAVVYATGAVAPGRSSSSPFTGQVMGSDTIAAAIKAAREDEDVKAVVLRIDSPGGSALASDIIWREVVLTKQKKPIVASMSDVAASGGYYIAMAASKIVAQPGTITGSIGVVSGKLDISGLYREHLGINVEIIKRGENADYYSEQRSFTEQQRAKFHQDLMDFYYTFVKKAADGRKKSPEEIDKVAQGRVWTGLRAKDLGLVDELGGMEKAIEVARQLAGLGTDTQIHLEEYPTLPTLFEAIFPVDEERGFSKNEDAIAQLLEVVPSEAREALRLAYLMQRFERDRVFAVMPYTLKIR